MKPVSSIEQDREKKPDSRAVFVGRRTYVIKLNSDCGMIQNLKRPIKHKTPKINIKARRFHLFYLRMFLLDTKFKLDVISRS